MVQIFNQLFSFSKLLAVVLAPVSIEELVKIKLLVVVLAPVSIEELVKINKNK